jgi:hypothetical protein
MEEEVKMEEVENKVPENKDVPGTKELSDLLDESNLKKKKEEEFNIYEWIKGIKFLERSHFLNPFTKK